MAVTGPEENRAPQHGMSRRDFLTATIAAVTAVPAATTAGIEEVIGEGLAVTEQIPALHPLLASIRSFTYHTRTYQALLKRTSISSPDQIPFKILDHYAQAVARALELQSLAKDPRNQSVVEEFRSMRSCHDAKSPDIPNFLSDEGTDWAQIRWLLTPERLKGPLRTVDVPSPGALGTSAQGSSGTRADFMKRCDNYFTGKLREELRGSGSQCEIPRSFQNPFSSWLKLGNQRSSALNGLSPNRRSQGSGGQQVTVNQDSADVAPPLATIARGYGEAAERPWSADLVAPPLCSALSTT